MRKDISMSPGLAPATKLPEPILDQIEISIWKGLYQADIILPTFEQAFGKPAKTRDGEAWYWKELGLFISRREKWAYRVIRFPATAEVLTAISPVLKLFPRKPNGKYAAQLFSAEIAWDFPISHIDEEPEEQLQKIVAVTVPANRKAKLRQKSSDFFYECSDGAINGLITFYFHSLSKYAEEEDTSQNEAEGNQQNKEESVRFSWMPSKEATWRGKAYSKRLPEKKQWNIRFEVTLFGSALKEAIGTFLPSELTDLPKRLAGLRFDDFWSFEQFDWPAFMEAARRSAKYKGISFADIERSTKVRYQLTRLNGLGVTMWQKRLARNIADIIGSKALKEKIGSKKFSTPLKAEDVLPKSDS